MNLFAMVIFYVTFERKVIDLDGVGRDDVEFQFHQYYIHPLEMEYHRLNGVIHIRLAFVYIHWMQMFESAEKNMFFFLNLRLFTKNGKKRG